MVYCIISDHKGYIVVEAMLGRKGLIYFPLTAERAGPRMPKTELFYAEK
jgi:hypothetical protein